MHITVNDSCVGAGKTYNAIKSAIVSGGRWLFAVERIEAIHEFCSVAAQIKNPNFADRKVIQISSDSSNSAQKRGDSVRIQIEALPDQYRTGNLIAFVTHEAILKCDFRDFSGWHFVCDEVPATLHIEKMKTKLDRAFFDQHYDLEKVHGHWSLIKPRAAGEKLTGSDLAQCDSHSRLRKLHETILGFDADRLLQAPLCNLATWSDMEANSVSWIWWSQFSFAHLSAFNSVTVLASRFFDSLAHSIAQKWEPELTWQRAPQLPSRSFKPRCVSISYFSQKQRATKSFFETSVGTQQLSLIGKYISDEIGASNFIWSSNGSIKTALESNLAKPSYYTPKQAGTSQLMNNDNAAMIYAAKPSNDVRAVLDAIDVSHSDWIRTVECETIFQFVSRTSVRDPASDRPVCIFVYDQYQAKMIAKLFDEQSHLAVDLQFVDLHLPMRNSKIGRPRQQRTVSEAEKAKAERLQKRAEQQRKRRAKKKLDEARP